MQGIFIIFYNNYIVLYILNVLIYRVLINYRISNNKENKGKKVMTKEKKDSYQLMDNMKKEVIQVINDKKDAIFDAQSEVIKALENQIMDKYSDTEFVLMKRYDLRNLMDDIDSVKGYTQQVEDEASNCTYNIEEVQSQSDYATSELSSVYDKLEEFSRVHEEVETEKGELNE